MAELGQCRLNGIIIRQEAYELDAAAAADTWPTWVPPTLLLGALLAVWEAVVRVADVPDYVLPAPSEVASALIDNAAVIAGHTASFLPLIRNAMFSTSLFIAAKTEVFWAVASLS